MKKKTIDLWGVSMLQCRAFKNGSWIEAISLGYTLLEAKLRLAMKVTKDKPPVLDEDLDRCRYLIDLAKLALDRGYISQDIYDGVALFNETRRKAIHHLSKGVVTLDELAIAAKLAVDVEHKIQNLFLSYKLGKLEVYQPKKQRS